jgi:hypothetical protein
MTVKIENPNSRNLDSRTQRKADDLQSDGWRLRFSRKKNEMTD